MIKSPPERFELVKDVLDMGFTLTLDGLEFGKEFFGPSHDFVRWLYAFHSQHASIQGLVLCLLPSSHESGKDLIEASERY